MPDDSNIPEPTDEDLLGLASSNERRLWRSKRHIDIPGRWELRTVLRQRWAEIQPQQKDFTETKSDAGERQPTDDELLRFMSPKTRLWWDRPNLTPQERARIWQGNKKLYFAARKANTGKDSDIKPLDKGADAPTPDKWLPQTSSVKPQETKTASKPLPPRWFNRYWWFRKLMAHPRWAEGGGLVMAGVVFLKGLDWQIDGAINTAALAFLVAWIVLSFAIYISSHWDRRRPLMMAAMIAVALGLSLVWYAYLPAPPLGAITTADTQPTPNSTATPDKPVSPVSESHATTEERVPLDIAPEKLLDFFEKYNEAQAEGLAQPYIGKWLEIRGRVAEVTRELAPLREDTRVIKYAIRVMLRTRIQGGSKPYSVTAIFEDQRWMDRAVVLKPNEDIIKIRGQIKHVFSHGFYLEHCEIIE